MAKILVYGASGAQGRPTASHLLKAGHQLRLLVRDPRKVEDLRALGAEVIPGDMADQAAVRAASQGMDGVFLLVPFFGGALVHAANAIAGAAQSSVRKIVWNASGTIPSAPTGNAGVDLRIDVLATLEASGLDYVALQPTVYMENLLGPWTAPELAAANTLAYPIPNTVRLQWISHQDAAAYSVAAFDQLGSGKHLVEICGPQPLRGTEMASAFSTALRRPITFRPMPPREFGAILDKAFGGGGDATAAFYEAVYDNPALLSTNVNYDRLSERLSITPTTMEGFARRHAVAFGGTGIRSQAALAGAR
jgi:uncharacterized protein YbjT (DUF2867 family)